MTKMTELPAGLHRNIPPAVYHQRERGLVSKSALDLVHRSPAHYRAWLDGAAEESSPALEFGSAFHCALLEPDRFGMEYAVEPDFGDCRKKEHKAARDTWRDTHVGRRLIAADDEGRVRAMVRSVREHPLAGKMVRDGDAELTVRWQDEASGLPCKTRADYYVRRLRMVVDVKSADDASFDAFRRSVTKYRYHVQDALYRASFAAVGEAVQHFVLVVVEKSAPHAVAIYSLDSDAVQRGYAHATNDMATLAECIRVDEWPGYPTTIQTLDLPPWAA